MYRLIRCNYCNLLYLSVSQKSVLTELHVCKFIVNVNFFNYVFSNFYLSKLTLDLWFFLKFLSLIYYTLFSDFPIFVFIFLVFFLTIWSSIHFYLFILSVLFCVFLFLTILNFLILHQLTVHVHIIYKVLSSFYSCYKRFYDRLLQVFHICKPVSRPICQNVWSSFYLSFFG